MAINKVVYGNTTLIDITNTTATAADVASGKVFYGANGAQITGTLEVPTPVYQTKTVTPTEQQQVVTADHGTVRIGTAVSSSSVKDTTTATWTVPITYSTTPAIGDTIVIDAKISVYTGSQSDSIYNVSHTFEWTGANHSYTTEPSDWSITVTSDTLRFIYKTVPATINRWTLTILNYTDSTQNGYISKQANYDALSSVTVEAISSTYIGSDIDRNTSSDLTASGATVTVPAGYYESSASKSIATGLVTVPYNISGASASVSTGTNTLTLTKTISVTPHVTTKGYISSGTAGNASVALTANVTTKGASTITPTTTAQTIASGTYLTGTQTIAAIPSQYIVPSGNVTLSSNGTGIDIAQYATATVDVAGSSVTVEPLSVTENGTYTAPTGTAYSPVTVNVSGGDTPEPEPTDGKTHIWIEIDENTPANRLKFTLRWKQTVSRGVRVDWGDGSDPETYAGTGVANREHTYPRGGEYEITLEVLGGELQFEGTTSSSGYAIYGSKASSNAYNRGRIFQMSIGNGVTRIGDNTFQYCYKLSSITIPNGVITIAASAFNRCYKLKSIKIPEGVTRIDEYIFYNCTSLESVEIPDSVESIGAYAFYGCSNLEPVIIPKNVVSIANNAFVSCNSLTAIALPDGLESIGNNAFQDCNCITDLIIPSTVTEIGRYAFMSCVFGRIRFEPTTPPTVANTNAFYGLPTDCVISVPVGTLAAYTTAANYPSSSTYTYIEE